MVCDSFCSLYSVLKRFVLISLFRSRILNVDPSIYLHALDDEDTRVEDSSEDVKLVGEPHPDERQIQLDTDRSFVLYPVGEPLPVSSHCPEALTHIRTWVVPMKEREKQQQELYDLIVQVFRKRRRLSYFQVRCYKSHIDPAGYSSGRLRI